MDNGFHDKIIAHRLITDRDSWIPVFQPLVVLYRFRPTAASAFLCEAGAAS